MIIILYFPFVLLQALPLTAKMTSLLEVRCMQVSHGAVFRTRNIYFISDMNGMLLINQHVVDLIIGTRGV